MAAAAEAVDALAALEAELAARVPLVTDRTRVARRSRDFFWYSPLLNEALNGRTADLLVEARDEADVVAVAGACARHGVPVTVRGGGTGNYGQCVPLQGGVVLDVTGLDAIAWRRDDVVRCGAGIKMNRLDAALAPDGHEIRMHPSTKRTATVGGFVAGGSGGVGSVTWGGLRERGNIRAARIVTLEATPRILELAGDDVLQIAHAYGTNGIITALEMPLAPAHPWIETIVVFDDLMQAARCGLAVAADPTIAKKLITPIAWPVPQWFVPLKAACPEGKAILIATVAAASMPAFRAHVAAAGGRLTLELPLDDSPGQVPLYEYTWNHTTLQVLKADRGYTYLQTLFPNDGMLELIAEIDGLFPGELFTHLELIEYAGRLTYAGLPVIRYTTRERLYEIIQAHEARGISVANPHVYTLEDGTGHKRVDVDQLAFKRMVDPQGLMNPGKMRSFSPAGAPA
jgi:FAD/FMN-containing dehydrogenase